MPRSQCNDSCTYSSRTVCTLEPNLSRASLRGHNAAAPAAEGARLDYTHHAERAWRDNALARLADLLWRARARSRVLASAYAAVAQVFHQLRSAVAYDEILKPWQDWLDAASATILDCDMMQWQQWLHWQRSAHKQHVHGIGTRLPTHQPQLQNGIRVPRPRLCWRQRCAHSSWRRLRCLLGPWGSCCGCGRASTQVTDMAWGPMMSTYTVRRRRGFLFARRNMMTEVGPHVTPVHRDKHVMPSGLSTHGHCVLAHAVTAWIKP